MDRHLSYRKEHREPCIVGPRGNLTNHHWPAADMIGTRVQPSEATHIVVTVTTIERGPAYATTHPEQNP